MSIYSAVEVLVTVGSTKNDFRRLVKEVDCIRGEGIIGQTFIQVGMSTYQPKHCDFARFLPRDAIERMMTNCRLVICHAGTGTLDMALGLKKTTIVVPRRVEYGEHPDNHQIELAQYLQERNRVLAVYNITELRSVIKSAVKWKPRFSSNNNSAVVTEIRRVAREICVSPRRYGFRRVRRK